MPQCMLLIYSPAENPISPEQLAEMSPKWDAYTEAPQDAGLHAARVPNIAYGSTEVRPILDMTSRQARAAHAQASA